MRRIANGTGAPLRHSYSQLPFLNTHPDIASGPKYNKLYKARKGGQGSVQTS
jgi:hypothetical protein